MKTYLEMSEAHWLQCLLNSIRNLYNPLPNENEKSFFEKRGTYLRYEKILQEEFSYHPTLSNIFLDKNVLEKLQWQYKLNFFLLRNEFNGELGYENLSRLNKRGKQMLVMLALQAQGINSEKLFPTSFFNRCLIFLKKLLKVTEI